MYDNPGLVLGYDKWDSVDESGNVICRMGSIKMSDKVKETLRCPVVKNRKALGRVI